MEICNHKWVFIGEVKRILEHDDKGSIIKTGIKYIFICPECETKKEI